MAENASAEPEPDQRVSEQEEGRPERHLLSRPELTEKLRPDPAEGVEERESGKNPQRKAAGGRRAETQERDRAHDAGGVRQKPSRSEPCWPHRDEEIADEIDPAPQDDDERRIAIDARLLDPGDDALDVGEHGGGFVGSNCHAVPPTAPRR